MNRELRITAWVALLALVWIIGMPPSTGPDEPVHIVRGAAIVRGEPTGEPTELSQNLRIIELPGTIGYPDHGCFSLQSLVPVTCAFDIAPTDADVPLGTTAWHYPIWGHLLPGLGTFVPGEAGNRAARIADALLPVLLIGFALASASRRGPIVAGTALVALTPMVWFMLGVVNPSGLVVAGGFALWIGLLGVRRAGARDRVDVAAGTSTGWWTGASSGAIAGPDRLDAWLVAAGWAAAVLPRRDGMLWAALAVAVWVVLSGVAPVQLLRRLGSGPLVVVGASTLATVVWAVTNKTDSARLLVVGPVLPFAADAVRRLWFHPRFAAPARRSALAAALLVVAASGALAVMSLRSGGFDASFLQRLVAQSGNQVEEAIGILGWLDVPLPTSALFAWLIALGIVAGVRVVSDDRSSLLGAVVVLAVAVPAAWIVEMVQGNDTGTYFQGRYYLPLLVAVPLLLGHRGGAAGAVDGDGVYRDRTARDVEHRVGLIAAVAGLGLGVVAFAAALRRFGVGIEGSILPWRWDTYPTVLPPIVTLILAVAASVGLGRAVVGSNGWSTTARR